MKLLITTQAVDQEHPVLGFFHEWIKELAPHVDSIEVICLTQGKHALPRNVMVHSLGKENRGGKLQYVQRFLSYIWTLRGRYDAVFVHMNPEYVLLGALPWKVWGKKIYLWYNHPKQGLRLSLALWGADTVFHTSPYAGSANTKKSVRMPAGIDTNLFAPKGEVRKALSIYLQGRVMPSKRVNTACEAIDMLQAEGINATLTVVGPEDEAYAKTLKERYQEHIATSAVTFLGPKPNYETPSLYASHAVAINLASSGHYDKTVLEAMACETFVITGGRAFVDYLGEEWSGNDTPEKLKMTLLRFFTLPKEEHARLGKKAREAIVAHESLPALIKQLSAALHS